MKFLKRFNDFDHGWDTKGYTEYALLMSIKYPKYKEMLAIYRNGILGGSTFHDAILEHLSYDRNKSSVNVILEGPLDDRFFHLTYKNVISMKVEASFFGMEVAAHELEFEENNVIHRIAFSNHDEWEIVSEEIEFSELDK